MMRLTNLTKFIFRFILLGTLVMIASGSFNPGFSSYAKFKSDAHRVNSGQSNKKTAEPEEIPYSIYDVTPGLVSRG